MDIPLKVLPQGLYCTEGDFFVDAWKPVPICLVTHGHGDHAYWGHQQYIASPGTTAIIKHRLGKDTPVQPIDYGKKIKLGNAWVSFHPAGHILGSSQIRIETPKGVTVISGDYKRAVDSTCLPYEVVECDIFVTESTFALPIYQWPDNATLTQQIFDWWQGNAANNHPSLLFGYALGKAQRILSLLGTLTDRTIYLHGAIYSLAKLYIDQGIKLPPILPVSETEKGTKFNQDLIIGPPSSLGTPWMKRFPSFRSGYASGWMQVRGTRRRHAVDRGFVLSDHADWNALLQTIDQSKAKIVLTTHGNTAVLAKYLREEKNIDARELKGLEHIEEGED